MSLGQNRGEAWVYLLIGLVLLIAGLISVFTVDSKAIYIGALVVGPIMMVRAIIVLRNEPASYQRVVNSGELPPQGRVAINNCISDDPIFLNCEKCGKEFINLEAARLDEGMRGIPSVVPENRDSRVLRAQYVVAPCPLCAHIQQSMFPVARGRLSEAWWGLAFFTMLAAALVAVRAINFEEGSQRSQWLIASGIILGVALLMYIWHRIRPRFHNPNRTPEARRLAEAREKSLSKEEYLNSYRSSVPAAVFAALEK